MKHTLLILSAAATLVVAVSCGSPQPARTLGAGIYPGAPSENFAPAIEPGGSQYRNIALLRTARHSSCADADCAAQLVTDGILSDSWKSAGSSNEWIEVDLGTESAIDRMVFHWVNAPVDGRLMVSADRKEWTDAGPLESECAVSLRARYVRAQLGGTADNQPFELAEWEIFGRGGTRAVPKPSPAREGSRQLLAGGAWKLCRSDLVSADGAAVSAPAFDDASWLVATVPGTVLGSYVNVGAVPHPNFADDQFYISDSYFRSDFWYRNTFRARIDSPRQFLHFEGVNWKAEVWLNGSLLGRIETAFRAQDFDVTGILKNGVNSLAVKIIHNEHYGTVKDRTAYSTGLNGGVLGADNPTMHASIGWDWIPPVRGRNMGIYDDVWLSFTGPVTVDDPFVRTVLPLPDTSTATVIAQATLSNHSDTPVSGTLRWSFGDERGELPVQLAAGESRTVQPEYIELSNPRLWWPRGYGSPELYPVSFEFECGGKVSDRCEFLSGVRQMDYSFEPYEPAEVFSGGYTGRDDSKRLCLYVNGRRFIGFGGNWGFPEHMLNYREREFDAAVAYHADMNFTMIRNWVGMTGSRFFYEACDRHGIMIWQDFWLANPWDGPEPADPAAFNETATRYVRRIRNHPSIALYVGRNEGYPPQAIEPHLVATVRDEHPGLLFIPHSAADGVSGGGPYNALRTAEYFHMRGMDKFHSEMGMPNVMNYENLVRTMGEAVEPVSTIAHPNIMYGIHDYSLGRVVHCAQQAESFNERIAEAFGEPENARQFAEWAQWINYDGYRAMFEARSVYRRGLLIWMSHPAWPSMVWQTYDYYLEPTAAYFGCKKACEPLHILLDEYAGEVLAVNYRAGNRAALTARARVLDMLGNEVWSDSATLDLPEDSTFGCFPLVVPQEAGDVYYVALELLDESGNALSRNFYVRGREDGNLQALHDLRRATLDVLVTDSWTVSISNTGTVPALMLRIKLVDEASGDLVLPVIYSDNYFCLLPGESRTISVSARPEDYSGRARIELSGFNY